MSERFLSLLRERHATPFRWGSSDCAMWAADAFHSLRGVDLAADLRGRYQTALQALRIITPMGGLRGLLCERLRPVACPVDGDVALTRTDGLGALAIWWQGRVIGQGADGLVLVPVSSVHGWWGKA